MAKSTEESKNFWDQTSARYRRTQDNAAKWSKTGNDLLCRILWQWAWASMKMQYQDAHPQPCQGPNSNSVSRISSPRLSGWQSQQKNEKFSEPDLGSVSEDTRQCSYMVQNGKRPTLSDTLAMGSGKHEDAIPRRPSPAVSRTKQQFSD